MAKKKKKAKAVKKGLKRSPKASKPVSLVKGKWIVCRGNEIKEKNGEFGEWPLTQDVKFFDSAALAADDAPEGAEVKKATEFFADSFSLDDVHGELVVTQSIRNKGGATTLAAAIAEQRAQQTLDRKVALSDLRRVKRYLAATEKQLDRIAKKQWTLEIKS